MQHLNMQRTAVFIILLLFLNGMVWSQGWSRHSLLLGGIGAAYGLGPVYEYMAIHGSKMGLGLSMNLPVVHASYLAPVYSPVSVSPGICFMYGAGNWKAESLFEYNYHLETGGRYRPPGADVVHEHTYAWMAGVRWQQQTHRPIGLLFRLGIGAARRPFRGGDFLDPCGYVMVGIHFGKGRGGGGA